MGLSLPRLVSHPNLLPITLTYPHIFMDPACFILILASFFFWWMLNLLLERGIGIQPRFFLGATIQHADEYILTDNQTRKSGAVPHLLKRNSKSLDAKGNFRVQNRPALIYTKSVALLLLVCVAVWQLVKPGGFEEYVDLFYHMRPESIQAVGFQVAASLTLSWYLFETVIVMQYYKLGISSIIHHWLTIIAATLVLMGVFIPYAIWYGIVLVGFVFPVTFFQGFRVHLGHKFPKLACTSARWSFYYFAGLVLVCLVGSIALVVQGGLTGNFGVWVILAISLSIIGWVYDDFQLVKHLKQAATFNYEDLNFELVEELAERQSQFGKEEILE